MKTFSTKFKEVLIIEPDIFEDERGYFFETWQEKKYVDLGLNVEFVQDNISFSKKGVLRGLHFQNPHPQGKLVMALMGEVLDVVVDIRLGSSSYGKWDSFILSGEHKRQLHIPPGFAHGFSVRSETAVFFYKCTDFFDPAGEMSIIWNGPDISIDWGNTNPTMSGKDRCAWRLTEIPKDKLFRFKSAKRVVQP